MTTEQENEEIKEKQDKLIQEARDVLGKIENFDVSRSTPDDLNAWLKRSDELSHELSDLMNELEVEDFLENGPGIKNKNV